MFYSLKGGVGRSTALMLWARRLVNAGKTVLVLELDLEAPGLGSLMLPEGEAPDLGTLDWLVEDVVANEANGLVPRMIAESPLADGPGLYVAPAMGARSAQHPENVLAKLARAYLEGDAGEGFSDRVRRLVEGVEDRVTPDVVLIDSRAGLHESVAANLLHLNAEALLFGVDVPATWEGYRYLFGHLRQLAGNADNLRPENDWRERLQMVQSRSGMTAGSKGHFASQAYSVWVDTLYDAVPSGEEETSSELFSFDESDEQAPHWPLAILRSDQFEAFRPLEQLASVGERAISEAFGEFFDGLESRLETLGERAA